MFDELGPCCIQAGSKFEIEAPIGRDTRARNFNGINPADPRHSDAIDPDVDQVGQIAACCGPGAIT